MASERCRWTCNSHPHACAPRDDTEGSLRLPRPHTRRLRTPAPSMARRLPPGAVPESLRGCMGASARSVQPGRPGRNDATPAASHRVAQPSWRRRAASERCAQRSGRRSRWVASMLGCVATLRHRTTLYLPWRGLVLMLPRRPHGRRLQRPGYPRRRRLPEDCASSRRLTHARERRSPEAGLPSAGPAAQASGMIAEWQAADHVPARFPAAFVVEPLCQPTTGLSPHAPIGPRLRLHTPVEPAEPASRA
jgi:hypothetical protein